MTDTVPPCNCGECNLCCIQGTARPRPKPTAAEIEATLNATDPVRKRSGKKPPEAPAGPSLFGDEGES